ncbi:hypothetical protein S245_028965, partial [Arachis hypogaea]
KIMYQSIPIHGLPTNSAHKLTPSKTTAYMELHTDEHRQQCHDRNKETIRLAYTRHDCKPRLPNRPPLPRPNHLYSEKVLFYHALNLLGLQPGTTPAPPTPTKAYNLIKPCQACSLTPSSLPLVNTSLNL